MFANLRQQIRSRTDTVMRAVLKNSGWAVTGQASNAIASLVETTLILRLIPEFFSGVFFTISAMSELIFGILDFRTGEAVIRFLPKFKNEKGDEGVGALLKLAFTVDFAVSIAGLLIIGVGYGLFMNFVKISREYDMMLLVIACGAALRTVVRSVGAYMRVANAFSTSIKLGVTKDVCRILLVVILVYFNRNVFGISIASAIADVLWFVIFAFGAFASFRKMGVHPFKVRYDVLSKEERRSVLKFLFNTNIAGTLRVISVKMDVIVINLLAGPATGPVVVAAYKIASRIAGTLVLFSDPLVIAVYPELTKLHAVGEIKTARRLVWTTTKILMGVAAFGIVAFVFIGRPILDFVKGKYYPNLPEMVLIMFAGTAVSTIFFWSRPMLLTYNLTGKLTWVTFGALIIQFGLLFLLVPTLHAYGSAIALAAGYIAHITAFMFLLYNYTDFIHDRKATT